MLNGSCWVCRNGALHAHAYHLFCVTPTNQAILPNQSIPNPGHGHGRHLSALVVVVPSSVVWASTGLLIVSIALINKRLLNFNTFFILFLLRSPLQSSCLEGSYRLVFRCRSCWYKHFKSTCKVIKRKRCDLLPATFRTCTQSRIVVSLACLMFRIAVSRLQKRITGFNL
jgi:hypothetical protein